MDKKAKQRAAQRRYAKRCLKNLTGGIQVRKEEFDWLKARKKELKMTWKDIVYRGLSARREDALNEIRVTNRKNHPPEPQD